MSREKLKGHLIKRTYSGLRNLFSRIRGIPQSDFSRNLQNALRLMLSERTTKVYLAFLLFVLFLGLFGPSLAPYGPSERLRTADGGLMETAPPSFEHPLGTTPGGYDVLSRVLVGAQPTVIAGLLGGTFLILIGLTIGMTAGYKGGWVDDILMRFTDLVYGVPLLPFALVLIALFGIGYFQAIFVIGLVIWRGSARVIRAQVLQIRERPFILSARATGGSTPYIITRHILPNVAPMTILFFALGTGYTIILIAGLAFLGVTNPFIPSWGVIIRNAYNSGLMADAWWWALPPGLLISFTVVSLFMVGRGYERVVNESEEKAGEMIVHGG